MGGQERTVDGYVSVLIESYGKKLGMNIDSQSPTREERLKLALKLDETGDHGSQWSAMEIMVGKRIDSSDTAYAMLFLVYKMGGMSKESFYEGFP